MKMKLGLIVLVLIVSSIPEIQGATGLSSYYFRVSKYQWVDDVRFKITVKAPIVQGVRCTPPKMVKYQLYKKDVYGFYKLKKSGWIDLRYRYRHSAYYSVNYAVAFKWFLNLDIGEYKCIFKMYENCAYRSKRVVKTFRVVN